MFMAQTNNTFSIVYNASSCGAILLQNMKISYLGCLLLPELYHFDWAIMPTNSISGLGCM